jgi:hypothetical protein
MNKCCINAKNIKKQHVPALKKILPLLLGLLRLWNRIGEKRKMHTSLIAASIVQILSRAYSAPFITPLFLKTKKGKGVCCLVAFAYALFFVTSNASIAPTTAIATIIAATLGSRYVSAVDCTGSLVGAGVAAAASTANDVSEDDP